MVGHDRHWLIGFFFLRLITLLIRRVLQVVFVGYIKFDSVLERHARRSQVLLGPFWSVRQPIHFDIAILIDCCLVIDDLLRNACFLRHLLVRLINDLVDTEVSLMLGNLYSQVFEVVADIAPVLSRRQAWLQLRLRNERGRVVQV